MRESREMPGHEDLRALQNELMRHPEKGDVITGVGGLRKLRFGDTRRGKGKRGSLRIVYHWWLGSMQLWLFTLYDKDEAADLTAKERAAVKALLEGEQEARR